MRFHSAEYLWFLIVIAVLLVMHFVFEKRKISQIQYASIGGLKRVSKTLKVRLIHLPFLLMILGLVFCVVALMRPQQADTKIKKNVEGIDIMIALDISDSMLIEDMKPSNRIEAAKETLQKFISKRSSDRIGIVIFAGESFTLVPLTLDYQLILGRVKEITTARQARIKDGTALGVAMANAAGRLKESTAKTRVIIFMTDGENNSGTIDPETGLDIAKGYGIKVYSIGIGRDGPTRIPVYQTDAFGNKVKTYQPFESTVNEDLLSRMAKDTGGKYYRASREDSLQTVFADIDSLEKTKIDINKFTRYLELFPFYLKMGMFFYLLGWLLSLTYLRRNPA